MSRAYYIEETVFLENNFYLFIEEVIKKDITIYVDSGLERVIENYNKINMIKESYLLDGFYSMLFEKGLLKCIDTKGHLETKNLEKEITTFEEFIIITQKETIFQTFKVLKKNKSLEIYKFKDGKLQIWKDTLKQETEAFYIKSDIYINKFDTDGIKYVFSPKYGYLSLDPNDVKSGGEGSCYPTYKNLYCKIYNKKHLTYTNLKKLQTMLEMDIFNPYIVWPKDLVYYESNFVGYVMDQIKDAKNLVELKDDNMRGYELPSKRAKICLNILKNIEYLHKKGILIGDLKDDNILVKSENEVYIIDSGSFQIGDYSCDVFTRGWTDKTYKGDELNKNLRKIEDEYYPINKLIFELMVLKNPHFDRNNLEIDYEKHTGFSFSLDDSNITVDSPGYLKNWTILSDRIKEFFYYYFKDSRHRRITYLNDWINEFELLVKLYEKHGK